MAHWNNLLGTMELLWLYGPPLLEIDPSAEPTWRRMHCDIALKVEAAFTSGKTEVYSVIDGYMYDFCSMTQLNVKFGTVRPIKRRVILHP